jgi:hypothetical protein
MIPDSQKLSKKKRREREREKQVGEREVGAKKGEAN